MASKDDFDYDDIISQNILIRKDDEDSEARTIEVLKKQSDDYESQYNRQAVFYQMDENPKQFLETTLKGDEVSAYYDSSSEGSEFGDFNPSKSIVIDNDNSSDNDWEKNKAKVKAKEGSLNSDQCEKQCSTKQGIDLHKNSDHNQKEGNVNEEQL